MSRENGIRSYRDLLVWQKGMELARQVYQLAKTFPDDERFGLVSQMRRAAVSVPSNIAEGQARQGRREFVQFLSHAEGSLAELDTQITLATDLKYCSVLDTEPCVRQIEELQRMIASLRRKIASRLATVDSNH